MTESAMPLEAELEQALSRLVERRPFLLALDFDGVVGPLVDDPDSSRPLPRSAAAIERLAQRDDVMVAFVSGRDLVGLTKVTQAPERVHLVGSHGAQWQDRLRPADSVAVLTDAEHALLAQVTEGLQAIVDAHPGTRVERKPLTAVLHTRLAEPVVAQAATAAALAGPGVLSGVKVTPGKDVVEIAVTHATKGEAVQWLRDHFGSRAVCFMGDDVTDETVFTSLREGDLGIKVGPGDTAAHHRVGSPVEVAEVLSRLADQLDETAGAVKG